MTPLGKIVTGIIVILAIGWAWMTYQSRPQEGLQGSEQAATQDNGAAAQDAAEGIKARGSSDTALDTDLKDIDAQLNAAAQSSASIDSSMNDKAGDVSY